jgi:hypothetical protein
MNDFEIYWRKKIAHNTEVISGKDAKDKITNIFEVDPVRYTKELIRTFKNNLPNKDIQEIFQCSACHLPHKKLERAKAVYDKTFSIIETHKVLVEDFKADIKIYKNLSDSQVNDIIDKGWGLAGIIKDDKIIATKIPSAFHEYFNESDSLMKKYYYCHCPRIKKIIKENDFIDSIYCNCGGGFYKDVWEYITGKSVKISPLKTLFDGDDVCQFEISFT